MLLEPHKDNPKFKVYIEKILAKKEWVEKVIEIVSKKDAESELDSE
jgi:hypothetical protein